LQAKVDAQTQQIGSASQIKLTVDFTAPSINHCTALQLPNSLFWVVGIILSSKPSPYISYYMLPSFLVVLQVHFGEAGEQNASVKDKGDNERYRRR